MKWLQISDLHFGYDGYNAEQLRHNLIEFVKQVGQIDFVLISGDCMYCNEDEGSVDFILELGRACNCSNENIFICPGNHDINLENRDIVLFEFDGDKQQYEALSKFGYEKFRKIFEKVTGKGYLPYHVIERHIGKEKFRIVTVDSCLFLNGRANQHNLSIVWTELEKLVQQIKNDEYINILTMHHSLDCFEPNSRERFRKWIEDNYIDLVFCGHSVVNEVNINISTKSHIQQFYSGMVPLEDNLTPNFWICQYEAGSSVVEMSLYTYDQKGTVFKSCLWNGDSYHYQILRKRENSSSFLKKTEDVIKTRKGSIKEEKLLFKMMSSYCKAIRNILNEPYDINNSTLRSVSPDGILCYNCLANKFNLFFPEAEMFIFREDTTPNLVTHPKTQEILYQLEYALDIIIDDLNQKKEYIAHHEEETIRSSKTDNMVFVVHGHDEGAKQTVARFLEQCGFVAVILHEQADGGRTIIEKIEQYADVVFAIVLYTPCDIGREKNEKRGTPRARQNVVFEHGYLIAKLGRERVCALVKQGVQTPGDIAGVVYKPMDSAGAWKTEILREMKSAGVVVDASKLL
jgi:predicted nucleotide-binding protein/predicted MPP superfamily phosphohydrolase